MKIFVAFLVAGIVVVGVVWVFGIFVIGYIFDPYYSSEKTTMDFVAEALRETNPEICFESGNKDGCIAHYAFRTNNVEVCLMSGDNLTCVMQFVSKDPDEKYCDFVSEDWYDYCISRVNDGKD